MSTVKGLYPPEWEPASTPLSQTLASWSTAPKCSSTRSCRNPSGSVNVRIYHSQSPGRTRRSTPES